MRVVHVEDRVVLSRNPCKRVQIGGVAGHAVDPVHADEPCRRLVRAQQALQVVRIFEGESLDGCAVRPCKLAAVVDRLVRAPVEEDRAVAGENRDYREMDEGDRRQDEGVFAPE